MPGRVMIGLSSREKHRAEFETSALPDEPQVTVWLVAGAAVVALVIIVAGSLIHQRAADLMNHFQNGVCANGLPPGHGNRCRSHVDGLNAVPMAVWFVAAGLAATLVIVAPFLTYMVKRSLGKV